MSKNSNSKSDSKINSKISNSLNSNIYGPPDSFVVMTAKNFLWGSSGLVLGVIVNDFVIYFTKKLKIKMIIVQNIIQMFICAVVLALLHQYHNYFGWSLQNVTEGLFFVSFFFGVQYKLFANVQKNYIINNNNI